MAVPHSASDLPATATLARTNGRCIPSPALIDLLVNARSNYDWPAGTGAAVSQQRIINLEVSVSRRLAGLNPAGAHQIVVDVSQWAGNNANSHHEIVAAAPHDKATMQAAIADLLTPANARRGIDVLCGLPGISLVIASKIYRFCAPQTGAAVDRHASYFFNSLGGGMATNFRREWANARHTSSRLAIYTPPRLIRNTDEYFDSYLPLLQCIANALNGTKAQYLCAVTQTRRNWTPADVEMAAYYWWACQGTR